MKFKCVQKSEPKSEWAQLDLVAIPRPPALSVCLSRLSARFSIASPSQIKVASLQLPFISFVMCSDYIKFYSGEPSSHTHRNTRGKICNLYWDGYDSISFTGMHWQCNLIETFGNGYRNYFRTLEREEKNSYYATIK